MALEEKLTRAWQALLGASLGDLFWYGLMACGVWLFYFVLFPRRYRHRRIAAHVPSGRQVAREIAQSLRSIAIFGLVAGVVVFAAYSGWTRLYVGVERYGWPWFFLSIAVMVVVHDTYFYWTHRLMHHPLLFRRIHRTHHQSRSPTPWAAYAFSPAEALIQAGIGPLIVCTIPVHPAAFALFMGWQIAFNVFGHCGHEVQPGWFLRSPAGWVLNSVTHHALHHEKFRANYGLYFNVWDRLMGTNHPDYERRFREATSGSAESSEEEGYRGRVDQGPRPVRGIGGCVSVKVE